MQKLVIFLYEITETILNFKSHLKLSKAHIYFIFTLLSFSQVSYA
jgi:hypothetical protein